MRLNERNRKRRRDPPLPPLSRKGREYSGLHGVYTAWADIGSFPDCRLSGKQAANADVDFASFSWLDQRKAGYALKR